MLSSDNLMKLAILDAERHPFCPSLYRLDKQLISLILVCETQIWLYLCIQQGGRRNSIYGYAAAAPERNERQQQL
ncbi:hypothetical protein [Paenibacillus polymyxa]|uniref:hypothetical protein n=1 Tax=Paenibacillus polymyxa TaxID=1406 RepID=UPI00308313E6